ncbi:MAG: ECF transporter S component [Clostridia bacterium]|nr:ECF transporter S component [Clostridia bacterium]
MTKKHVRRLTYAGLLAALITMLTAVFRIVLPPLGYYHIGDGAVLLSGMLLGPYGAFPAAVGAALADLLSGFPNYVFYRAAIKGGMALISGKFLRVDEGLSRRNVLILALTGLWHILGHLVADALIYSSFTVALSLIGGNLVQAAIALVLGCALLTVTRIFPKGLR